MWPWLLQRVTAVVLVVGLAIHLIVLHAFNLGDLNFDNVAARVASWFFAAVDLSLLGAGLFHALNGTRMVLLDYGFAGTKRRALGIVLWVVGVLTFVYGTWALWPWLTA
jgi:succinate dehydrogenase cytochrome b556 subunit